jgi:hypothetical protein
LKTPFGQRSLRCPQSRRALKSASEELRLIGFGQMAVVKRERPQELFPPLAVHTASHNPLGGDLRFRAPYHAAVLDHDAGAGDYVAGVFGALSETPPTRTEISMPSPSGSSTET